MWFDGVGVYGRDKQKAPTLPTAAFNATSAQTQPKRQSVVLSSYYTSNGAICQGATAEKSAGGRIGYKKGKNENVEAIFKQNF